MKTQSKTTVKTPVKDLKKGESIEHYNAVLLEEIKSDMKQVIEGMESTKSSIHKEMQEFRGEVNEHFRMTDFAIAKHSEQLQNIEKDVSTLKSDVSTLKSDVKEIKTTVKRMEEKFDSHETRLTTVEEKIETHLIGHP